MPESLLDKEILAADDVLLVPKRGLLRSRDDAKIDSFIYSAPMDTVTGPTLSKEMSRLGQKSVVSRFLNEDVTDYMLKSAGDSNVFWAVGADIQSINEFIQKWKKAVSSAPLSCLPKISLAIDIAHGDSVVGEDALNYIKKTKSDVIDSIMCGSICTPDAAIRMAKMGVTHLRVGVGSGSVCTTRQMTGCGYPQLSAVYQIHKTLEFYNLRENVVIIADGGIRTPGDAVKYIAAGADAVMLGRLLSKTHESAGWVLQDPADPTSGVKTYRGQASADFQKDVLKRKYRCPEGVSEKSSVQPSKFVEDVVNEFAGGMASALSYLGLTDIKDLGPESVEFIKVTSAAHEEGTPHANRS